MNVMVPFKVMPEQLSDEWYTTNLNQDQLREKVINKVWTVVAHDLATNVGQLYYVLPEGSASYNEYKGTLYLLVIEGETPVWYPEEFCTVLEVPRV